MGGFIGSRRLRRCTIVMLVKLKRKTSLCHVFQLLKGTNLKFWLRRRITLGMRDTPTKPELYIGINTYEIFVTRVLVGVGIVASIITKLATPLAKDRRKFVAFCYDIELRQAVFNYFLCHIGLGLDPLPIGL